jgi:hypothetical protein
MAVAGDVISAAARTSAACDFCLIFDALMLTLGGIEGALAFGFAFQLMCGRTREDHSKQYALRWLQRGTASHRCLHGNPVGRLVSAQADGTR